MKGSHIRLPSKLHITRQLQHDRCRTSAHPWLLRIALPASSHCAAALQVLCNGGVPLALALCYAALTGGVDVPLRAAAWRGTTAVLGAFLGYMCCCCGDTWASELGQVSSQRPWLITTGRPIRKVGPPLPALQQQLAAQVLPRMLALHVCMCVKAVAAVVPLADHKGAPCASSGRNWCLKML